MSGLRDRHLVGGAASACAVCCAAPIIGFLGVAGFAATAVTLAFAGVVFAIVVGLATVAAVLARRSRARRAACAAPPAAAAPVPVELARPAPKTPPDGHRLGRMTIAKSLLLFVVAAVGGIGGAWLVWQGVRENKGLVWVGAGVIALGLYGFVATLQPDAHFGRILAAYGGVFVAGSLLRGVVMGGFRPDRYDIAGALICLVGVAVIMYSPRTV